MWPNRPERKGLRRSRSTLSNALKFKDPTQCHLWTAESLRPDNLHGVFEFLETYEDDSHLGRHLVKCRRCGQLYFHEFYEEIDWAKGNDPQYNTYIPVYSRDDIELLKKASAPTGLFDYSPRLQSDWPSDNEARVYWIGRPPQPENAPTPAAPETPKTFPEPPKEPPLQTDPNPSVVPLHPEEDEPRLKTSERLRKAIAFAIEAHGVQKYGKEPYATHLHQVAETLHRFYKNVADLSNRLNIGQDEFLCAAWLHDTIEDTGTTREQIEKEFGANVANLVWAVTNESGATTEEKAKTTYRKIGSVSGATLLKLADRIANLETCIRQANGKMKKKYRSLFPLMKEFMRSDEGPDMWAYLETLQKDVEPPPDPTVRFRADPSAPPASNIPITAHYRCVKCRHDTLDVIFEMKLPPDKDWEVRSLQMTMCSRCRFQGLAVYKEKRQIHRGKERLLKEHTGYWILPSPQVSEQVGLWNQCQYWLNPYCPCATHQTFSRNVAETGACGVPYKESFRMRVALDPRIMALIRGGGWALYVLSFFLPAAQFIHPEGISPKGPYPGYLCAAEAIAAWIKFYRGGFPWLFLAMLASLSNGALLVAVFRKSRVWSAITAALFLCSIPAMIKIGLMPHVGYFVWALGMSLLLYRQ